MGKFKWGHAFLSLNRELLERYSLARDASEILHIQNEFLHEPEPAVEEKGQQKDREWQDDSDDLHANPNHVARFAAMRVDDDDDNDSEEDEDKGEEEGEEEGVEDEEDGEEEAESE
jgi:pre-rRNA-processing protein TSR3